MRPRLVLCLLGTLCFPFAHAEDYVTIRKAPASRYDALTSAQLVGLTQSSITVIEDYGPFAVGTSVKSVDIAAASRASGLVVVDQPSFNRISVSGVDIDTRPGAPALPGVAPGLRLADYPAGGDGLYLIQFAGPPRPAWLSELAVAGFTTVRYVDTNAYIVRASAGIRALKERTPSRVKFIGPYEPFAKLSPELRAAGATPTKILAVWDGTEPLASVQAKTWALDPKARITRSTGESHALLEATLAQVGVLAADPHVLFLEISHEPMPSDERAAQIAIGNTSGDGASGAGQYLNNLESACYSCFHDMSSEIVDVVDTGLYAHPDLTGGVPGRLAAAGAFLGVTGTVDNFFHGTFVAGVIGGNPLQSGGTGNAGDGGFYWGMGVAPTVRFMNSRIFNDNGNAARNWVPADIDTLTANAYNNSATVQNNSWNYCTTGYDAISRRYDIHVRDAVTAADYAEARRSLTVVFSAGNRPNCNGDAPVAVPANAKNVISVGGSSFWRPQLGGNCDTAGGISDVSGGSKRGVAGAAARFKPDLVAASTSSTSAVSAVHNGTGCNGFNTIDSNYYADAGTSFSAPLVTGAAVLLKRRLGVTPSPALTKAFLLGSAASLSGGVDQFTGTTLGWEPAVPQGFGRLNLQEIIGNSTPTQYKEEDAAGTPVRRFTATGQYHEVTYNVSDWSKPVIIMLVYTDAPSAENSVGNAVNVLNMVAYTGYGWSWHDGSTGSQYTPPCTFGGLVPACWLADTANNVKWIKIDSYFVSSFTVQVVASSITAKAVPGLDAGVNQDWALYVYNAY